VNGALEAWRDLPRRARLALGILGPVALYLLLYQVVPGASSFIQDKAPHEPIVIGTIIGTTNALLAMGLILIYRANRFINFAYGAMGSLFGMAAIALHLQHDLPYFLVLPIAVVAGIILGGVIEAVAIRRFQNSTRLIVTVASIGLAQLLGGIELLLNKALDFVGLTGGFSVPISWKLDIGNTNLGGDQLLIVAIVPFVIAGLAWFLLRTDAGVAVRAAAENSDRALLLGIPVRRLSTIVWMIAGGLSTLTFLLKAPFSGVNPSVAAGPTVILPALAAAVIARMESLPVAFAAGIGLGIVESLVRWNTTGTPTFTTVVFLVVILGALLLQRGRISRAQLTGMSSWSGSAVVKPTPEALRRLPEVRWAKVGLLTALALVFVLVPRGWSQSSQLLAAGAMVFALTAVSLVVLTGWGGHISLGQFGIVGVGAFVAGNLVEARVDLFLALLAAGAAGGLVAVLVGLPALRIQGLFLAVTTLALAVALDQWFLSPDTFASLVPGVVEAPVVWERFDLDSNYQLYVFCLVWVVLGTLVARGVRNSRSGRVVIATRDNGRAADAAAVPTTGVKLSAFLLAGVMAGIAGGLHVVIYPAIGSSSYNPDLSIDVFTTAVIGGLGSVTGAVAGVLAFQWLGTWQALGQWRLVVTGVGLLVVLYAVPGGFGQVIFSVRDRYLRWVANRHDILVPSLVADKRVAGEADHAADEVDLLKGALGGAAPVGAGR